MCARAWVSVACRNAWQPWAAAGGWTPPRVKALPSGSTFHTALTMPQAEHSCIRVLLVDDHAVVRAGYRFLLSYHEDIEVVAEAGSGDEALALLAEQAADIVVVDLTMPGMHGLELLKRVRELREAP